MRVYAGTWSFLAPPGLQDVTGYSFKARGARELLDVQAARMPDDAHDLDSLLAARRLELEGGLPGAFTIAGEGTAQFAGLAARTLTFGFTDGGEASCERWALAQDTRDSYVQIAYAAPADADEAQARFDHALASASLTDATSATPGGWARRWAGCLWLDVPEHLDPPRRYHYLASDEALRVEVAVHAERLAPSITRELQQDTARGESITGSTSREFVAGAIRGQLYTYTRSRSDGRATIEESVRRAQIAAWRGSAVHLFGRARRGDEALLEATVLAILQSLEQVAVRGP